jgi:hypothetical protein
MELAQMKLAQMELAQMKLAQMKLAQMKLARMKLAKAEANCNLSAPNGTASERTRRSKSGGRVTMRVMRRAFFG